jgi:hypothetical protein
MRKKNTIAKIGKRAVTFGEHGAVELSPGQPSLVPGRGPSARGPPIDPLLTVPEVADLLRCSVSSLNKWRLSGNGPKFVYVGRRVRYRPSDILTLHPERNEGIDFSGINAVLKIQGGAFAFTGASHGLAGVRPKNQKHPGFDSPSLHQLGRASQYAGSATD